MSTAVLDCCNSGMVRAAERLTELRCCFVDIGSGSFSRFLSFLLTEILLTRTSSVGTAVKTFRVSRSIVTIRKANSLYNILCYTA